MAACKVREAKKVPSHARRCHTLPASRSHRNSLPVRYRVKLILKNGRSLEGKAIDTFTSAEKREYTHRTSSFGTASAANDLKIIGQ